MAAMAGSAAGGIVSAIAGTSGQSGETSTGLINQKSMGFANFFGIDAFWNGSTNIVKLFTEASTTKAFYDSENIRTVEDGIKNTTFKPTQNLGYWILLALVVIVILVIVLAGNKNNNSGTGNQPAPLNQPIEYVPALN